MTAPAVALSPEACDRCHERTPVATVCSTCFIDELFPEAEDQRKPRNNEGHRYYGGERG